MQIVPTMTAIPLRSELALAAVADVFGTVLVPVSQMWIFSAGMRRARLATCNGLEKSITLLLFSLCHKDCHLFLSPAVYKSHSYVQKNNFLDPASAKSVDNYLSPLLNT